MPRASRGDTLRRSSNGRLSYLKLHARVVELYQVRTRQTLGILSRERRPCTARVGGSRAVLLLPMASQYVSELDAQLHEVRFGVLSATTAASDGGAAASATLVTHARGAMYERAACPLTGAAARAAL